MDNVRIVLDEIEVNFDTDDINIVKDVCFLVTDRSAKLVAISKIIAYNWIFTHIMVVYSIHIRNAF